MNLTERIPLLEINYLKTLTFDYFKTLCKSSTKNDEERKKQFNILKSFCETNIKTRGETKRVYAYTLSTPLEVGGRLYCGNSIQGLPKDIRGFLMKNVATDIDMKNAHPVILRYICKLHNIPCPNLNWYITNRDTILNEMGSEYKTEFLKAVNSDKINRKIKDKFFKDFDKEMKKIQGTLITMPEYKHIVDTVPLTRTYNWNGSAINRILCVFENKILQTLIDILSEKSIEICALMFDGLMIYGNYYEDNELLDYITAEINNTYEGLDLVWTYKEHSDTIKMPEDFQIPGKEEKIEIDNTFENVAIEFEKTHAKIINKALFIKETENDTIFMSKTQLVTAYEDIIYRELNSEGKIVEQNFISKWTRSNPGQRVYDDIGIYPDSAKCPKNIYNIWKPFAMELVMEYEEKIEERNALLNHIKILCGNDKPVFQYIICWIAQMIQYPDVKSICPTFISKEGAGKGTLLMLLRLMLGNKKVFETSNPSRDVWGNFNGQMSNCFLVNLNELSKKDTIEAEGVFKNLVTDGSLTINNKGVNAFEITSHHRFIITTNNEDPIKTTKDDRRKLIIRSSDEKCGDIEYFECLYKLMEDVNVIKTCYEYFKGLENIENFKHFDMPVTEHQKNLKELSLCPIEQWLYDLTLQNYNESEVEMLGCEAFSSFKNWRDKNDIKYEIDSKKLGVRLTNMKVPGIKKGRHTRKGETKIYDINDLKTYFKIGCLLDYSK